MATMLPTRRTSGTRRITRGEVPARTDPAPADLTSPDPAITNRAPEGSAAVGRAPTGQRARSRRAGTVRRATVIVALVASALALAACGSSASSSSAAGGSRASTGIASTGSASAAGGSSSATATSTRVVIQNFTFHPSTLTVKPGATITVVNKDSTVHTFTARDGSFNTGDISPGSTATVHAPTKPGTYPFYCLIHQFMTGTLTVS